MYYSIKVPSNLMIILNYDAKHERHSVSVQQKTYTVQHLPFLKMCDLVNFSNFQVLVESKMLS